MDLAKYQQLTSTITTPLPLGTETNKFVSR